MSGCMAVRHTLKVKTGRVGSGLRDSQVIYIFIKLVSRNLETQ